jgi:hypothetical protein
MTRVVMVSTEKQVERHRRRLWHLGQRQSAQRKAMRVQSKQSRRERFSVFTLTEAMRALRMAIATARSQRRGSQSGIRKEV